jgi:fumarate reductase subunit C
MADFLSPEEQWRRLVNLGSLGKAYKPYIALIRIHAHLNILIGLLERSKASELSKCFTDFLLSPIFLVVILHVHIADLVQIQTWRKKPRSYVKNQPGGQE